MYPSTLSLIKDNQKVRGEGFEEWIAWSALFWFAGKQKRQRVPGSGKIRGFSQMTALLATRTWGEPGKMDKKKNRLKGLVDMAGGWEGMP